MTALGFKAIIRWSGEQKRLQRSRSLGTGLITTAAVKKKKDGKARKEKY